MDENPNNKEQWLKDLPLTTEKPGFKADEMLECGKCARKNPPTRHACIYCGATLAGGAAKPDEAAPEVAAIKAMEPREKGFNLILLNGAGVSYSNENLITAARLLRWDPQALKAVVEKERPLPVVRTSTAREAETLRGQLKEAGFDSIVWPDEEVSAETPTRRLRGANFGGGAVTFQLFNGDAQQLNWNDIVMVVSGSLFEKKVASTEKRMKKDQKQVTDSSEMSSDEAVLDIYLRDDDIGFRVMTKGFDFSCLGKEKGMLAVENIKRLASLIMANAPNAKFDDGYNKLRTVLGNVWENEQSLAKSNMQREGMGKFNFENVTVVDNNLQFTKYSRLQKRLLKVG